MGNSKALGLGMFATFGGIVSGLSVADEVGSGPFAGMWVNVEMDGTHETSPGCRYADVQIRRYDLGRNYDGKAVGTYYLQHLRLWIARINPECGRDADIGRVNTWSLVGSLDGGGSLRLAAIHLTCIGQCNQQVVPEQFATSLNFSEQGRFLDAAGGAHVVFESAEHKQDLERGAIAALSGLLRPLLDKDCNRFYAASLDPGTRLRLPISQDVYCQLLAPMGAILSHFKVDSPAWLEVVTSGLALPGASPSGMPPFILADDVVVQRFLSSADGSGGVWFTVLMRLQPDGSWRIREIL